MFQFRFLHRRLMAPISVQKLSYSQALGKRKVDSDNHNQTSSSVDQNSPNNVPGTTSRPEQFETGPIPPIAKRRALSPEAKQWQKPKTETAEETVYILTLETTKKDHKYMTELRRRYFPQRLNRVSAHLTLFHALPGSRLESDILPSLEALAGRTKSFTFKTAYPERIKQGFIIPLNNDHSLKEIIDLRTSLQTTWCSQGFLSDQDSRRTKMHYTIMNKESDQGVIDRSLNEVRDGWHEMSIEARGFSLYEYRASRWKYVNSFPFLEQAKQQSELLP